MSFCPPALLKWGSLRAREDVQSASSHCNARPGTATTRSHDLVPHILYVIVCDSTTETTDPVHPFTANAPNLYTT